MEFLVGLLTGFAVVSLPVMYAIERKYGLTKTFRRVHGALFLFSVLYLALVCIVLKVKLSSTTEGISGWANDFFFSYFTPTAVCTVFVSAVLCGAAAIRHNMKRVRMIVAMLLPVVVVAIALFTSSMGENGYFAIDFYVRASAPGLMLLTHAVPLCERRKKHKKST